jgi:hypothetical protein
MYSRVDLQRREGEQCVCYDGPTPLSYFSSDFGFEVW